MGSHLNIAHDLTFSGTICIKVGEDSTIVLHWSFLLLAFYLLWNDFTVGSRELKLQTVAVV